MIAAPWQRVGAGVCRVGTPGELLNLPPIRSPSKDVGVRLSLGRSVAIPLLLLTWSKGAIAYRPFDSTDADVAKLRAIELELGPLHYLHEGARNYLVVPALVVNAGLLEGWELVLEGRNEVEIDPPPNEPRLQIVGTALSLKGVLREGSLQERTGFSVASEVGTLLPTTPESGVGASGAVILSERWSFGTMHLNGGLALSRSHKGDAFGGVILEGPFDWVVRPVAEGFFEREVAAPSEYSALAGAIWRARDNLSFDAAIRRGRATEGTLTEVRAGLTWTLEP
jgi:hypothetical protein